MKYSIIRYQGDSGTEWYTNQGHWDDDFQNRLQFEEGDHAVGALIALRHTGLLEEDDHFYAVVEVNEQ